MAGFDHAMRSNVSEHIDSPAIRFHDMQRCLRDIEKINIATLGYRPTLCWLDAVTHGMRLNAPLKILDVGCGSGDGLRQIWRWARRRGIDVDLAGIDISPHACRVAESRSPANMPVRYSAADVFDYDPGRPADLIVNSLFTHHLKEAEIVSLLRWMDAHAARGWFVNDLHRHWLPYHFIRLAAAGFRLDPIVRHDAPVSVARGFTAQEWRALLAMAGLSPDRTAVRWFFPFRHGVSCLKA